MRPALYSTCRALNNVSSRNIGTCASALQYRSALLNCCVLRRGRNVFGLDYGVARERFFFECPNRDDMYTWFRAIEDAILFVSESHLYTGMELSCAMRVLKTGSSLTAQSSAAVNVQNQQLEEGGHPQETGHAQTIRPSSQVPYHPTSEYEYTCDIFLHFVLCLRACRRLHQRFVFVTLRCDFGA